MKAISRSSVTVVTACLLFMVCGAIPATAQASKDKPITFTMFVGEPGPNADNFQSPVAREILKQTGVTLQMEYVVNGGDETTKVALMAASGDYPDLIYPKAETAVLRNADGIIVLDDLIEKHGPNIKKFYGDQFKRLYYANDDRHVYYVGGFAFGDEDLQPSGDFEVQHAVVKEAGFPRIRTLADFEKVITDYYRKHPTYNGQPTIPLALLTDGWRYGMTVTNPACWVTGGPDDGEWYVDQKTFKTVRHETRPEEREFFTWLNHMWNSGLLDPESFVQKYDQYKSKIASGRVLALMDSRWEINEPLTALRKAGMYDRMYGWYPSR
jgi:putative aldouronate transport system substrate-binding protein